MNCFQAAKRIVVKIGTSTLTHDTGVINIRRMENLVKVLADIKNSGRELVIVTSAAISVGVGKLGLSEKPKDMPSKQAAAAVGQCELMYLYDKTFSEYNHIVSQLLLTRDMMENAHWKQNIKNTFCRLLEMGAIPIVNENDTVNTEEIEFGDNDTLSALVATLVGADALIIMSDVAGLYTANPQKDPSATLIPTVTELDDNVRALAQGAGTQRGTGGMITKLHAADIVMPAGIDMAIICGDQPTNLYRLFDGEPIGTHFVASKK